MGLGKSLQSIALVWTMLKQGPRGGANREAGAGGVPSIAGGVVGERSSTNGSGVSARRLRWQKAWG